MGTIITILITIVVVIVLIVGFLNHLKQKSGGNLKHGIRALRGHGHTVEELARRLDVPIEKLQSIQPKYHEAQIPKRRGGTRKLLIPSDELKHIQRKINRRLLARLRTHTTATGFEPNVSIVHNAKLHVNQAVLIKLDIVDFFSNTSAKRVNAYFKIIGWNKQASSLLTMLTTIDTGLPQGAPTSPRLSNLVNYGLDAKLDRFVAKRHGIYSRYADDITISYPKDYPKHVRGAMQYAKMIAKVHGYQIHKTKKLSIVRRHRQQRVTGLVVNEKVNLPRTTRRRLRAIEHHIAIGKPATLTEAQIAGWRALQKMIQQQG